MVEGAKAWLMGRGWPLSKETGLVCGTRSPPRTAGDGVFTLRLGARGLTGAQLEHKPLLQAGGSRTPQGSLTFLAEDHDVKQTELRVSKRHFRTSP